MKVYIVCNCFGFALFVMLLAGRAEEKNLSLF